MSSVQILVVDDEQIVAKSLQIQLERLGYSVPVIASSGEEAIQKAVECQPDLVLMDIVLRGAMDGIEAARQIRALRNVPVIFATAYADDDTFQRARTAGPAGYLCKPFGKEELQRAIEIALSGHIVAEVKAAR